MRPDPHHRLSVVAALALLLLVGPSLAQVFLPARRVVPYQSSTIWTNLLPNGIVLWWHAEDLSSSPVSVWTDRVQGYNWTQGTGASQPAWSSDPSVDFDGTNDFLNATNMTVYQTLSSNNHTWLVTLKLDSVAPGKMIFADSWGGGNIFLGIGDDGGYFYGPSGNSTIGVLPGNWLTCIFGYTTNAANALRFYTNGVQGFAGTTWVGTGAGGFAFVGSGSGNARLRGSIYEVIVWSNLVLTAQNVVDIHKYATNTLDFTVPPYTANTAVFDGVNDYVRLIKSSWSDLSDAKSFTFSGWVRIDGGNNTNYMIYALGDPATPHNRVFIQRNNTNILRVVGRKNVTTGVLDVSTVNTLTSADGWTHLYVSVNLAGADTNNCKIYFNGVQQNFNAPIFVDDTMDFVIPGGSYTFGGDVTTSPIQRLEGALSDVWWRGGTYSASPINFSDAGCPYYIGFDGSIAIGAYPHFYLDGDGDGFAVNKGSAGGMTLTGSLGTTTPPCP